jgi:hypothetical protein
VECKAELSNDVISPHGKSRNRGWAKIHDKEKALDYIKDPSMPQELSLLKTVNTFNPNRNQSTTSKPNNTQL